MKIQRSLVPKLRRLVGEISQTRALNFHTIYSQSSSECWLCRLSIPSLSFDDPTELASTTVMWFKFSLFAFLNICFKKKKKKIREMSKKISVKY